MLVEPAGARGDHACAARSELDGVDGLVIPGGESTTMDKLVRAFDLHEPLRERIADGMPAYGSCAGMIMLADRIADARPDQQTLGGLDITVRRNAFGRQVDSFEEDLHIRRRIGRPGPVPGRLHPGALGRGGRRRRRGARRVEEGPAAGRIVAVRQGNLLATSFHPEVTGDHRVHECSSDGARPVADRLWRLGRIAGS